MMISSDQIGKIVATAAGSSGRRQLTGDNAAVTEVKFDVLVPEERKTAVESRISDPSVYDSGAVQTVLIEHIIENDLDDIINVVDIAVEVSSEVNVHIVNIPKVGGEPTQLSAGTHLLGYSPDGVLYLLTQSLDVSGNVHMAPTGQSYDAFLWEPAMPLLFDFTCYDDKFHHCAVTIPNDGHTYELWGLTVSASNEEQVSRFLMKSTFGPTLESIAAFPNNGDISFFENAKQWVTNQISIPPTSHREYYRKGANAVNLQAYDTGGVRLPCEVNSRWVRVTDNAITSPTTSLLLVLKDLTPPVEGVKLLSSFQGSNVTCDLELPTGNVVIYAADAEDNSVIYQYEGRLRLYDNTIYNPAYHSHGSTSCPSVKKNFLNEDECVVNRATCGSFSFTSGPITLNAAFIRKFYDIDKKFVYITKGLRTDDEPRPCTSSYTRWEKVGNEGCPAESVEVSEFISFRIVDAATGMGPESLTVDIYSRSDDCLELSIGAKVKALIDGVATCWQHVHPDLYNIYDFSDWAKSHPGGISPIRNFLEVDDSVEFVYPNLHQMIRWKQNHGGFTLLGTLGDVITFDELPFVYQSIELAEALGFNVGNSNTSATAAAKEACGSIGEISNDPSVGFRFHINIKYRADIRDQTLDQSNRNVDNSKRTVWLNIVLNSKDQLRQRVAFALSQLFVINVDRLTGENHQNYMDIFVRHAFGNFRDILKEVSFSPMMAKMLTYIGSRSFAISLDAGKNAYPDENYAREIMQLFTFGLWELQMDGRPALNENGEMIPTYTQEDVLDYSRVWTGFVYESSRGNIENFTGNGATNYIDPVKIIHNRHDTFPKLGVKKQYLGDGYPPCWRLPEKHFLRSGAKYRYIGNEPNPDMHTVNNDLKTGDYIRLQINSETSDLYKELCKLNAETGECELKSVVYLSEDIGCDGIECDIDTIRLVQITLPGDALPVYYEYLRQPCVEMTFAPNAKVVTHRNNKKGLCLDPRLDTGLTPCCDANNKVLSVPFRYSGEQASYRTGVERCHAEGLEVCEGAFLGFNPGKLAEKQGDFTKYWSNANCTMQIFVEKTGRITTKMDLKNEIRNQDIFRYFSPESIVPIRVLWDETNGFPIVQDHCGTSDACEVKGNRCLCDTEVKESQVINSLSAVDSSESLLKTLHIGAVNPSGYGPGVYSQCTSPKCTSIDDHGVKVFFSQKSGNQLDMDTIFEISTCRGKMYFFNTVSTVVISDDFQFRNPPNFISNVETNLRDAYHEVDAALNHYIFHSSTPPFIASFFIEKFTTSNPSPAYVKRVAVAFKSGIYSGIGSGQYGDISATIAAVVLDREATSVSLSSNSATGRLREPLLKIIHILRALGYETINGNEAVLENQTSEILGQMVYEAPNVFNFFQTDYIPNGVLGNEGLYSGEAQLITTPRTISYLNAIQSLLLFGMTNCFGGFGHARVQVSCSRLKKGKDKPEDFWSGDLTYWDPSVELTTSMLDELDLLLTGGRLSPQTRELIEKAYEDVVASESMDAARVTVLQMLLSSSEFHTSSNLHISTTEPRRSDIENLTHETPATTPPTTTNESSSNNNKKSYKALVYLFMHGGADTFNLIVPMEGCSTEDNESYDMYTHYKEVRTGASLMLDELLPIDVQLGSQVCSKFGVNHAMPNLTQLYKDGDLAFFANVGALVEPVTKEEFETRSKRLPPSLFAHNVQQKAAMSLHAEKAATATGILGRIKDIFTGEGVKVKSYSIKGNSDAVRGSPGISPAANIVDGKNGMVTYDNAEVAPFIREHLEVLVQNKSSALFAETWLSSIENAFLASDLISISLENANLATDFPATKEEGADNLAFQMKRVSELIASRSTLETERDIFFVSIGGFDTHNNAKDKVYELFRHINSAVSSFAEEMKGQELWNDVAIVTASDFARTMTFNGQGTDHAWGGNAFIAGGALKGGQIFGKFPEKLDDTSEMSIGRGRLIPTSSWESIWTGLVSWFGIPEDKLSEILPHLDNFPPDIIFTKDDLFETV